MRISDKMRQTIIFVGRKPEHGGFMAYGTAFLVASFVGHTTFQNLITARHVIDRIPGDEVHLRVNTRDGDATVVATRKEHWFPHPDRRVDLAVGATLLRGEQFDVLNMRLDQGLLLTRADIDRFKIGIGDEVAISGLYVSRMGEKRNLPIARSGIIAAMPEEKIKTTYGYHDAYLIETRSIDGLSGSPVFVQLSIPRFVEGQPVAITVPTYFMGVLLGANWVEAHDDAIEIAEGDAEPSEKPPSGALNTGIGIVLPAHYVIEAIEQPLLRQKREEALKKPARSDEDPA